MESCYSIHSLIREDSGIVKVVVHFFEGVTSTLDEKDENGNLIPVTRYRNTAKIRDAEFIWSDNPTEADIISRLNTELVKDTTRTPIPEQVNA